MLKKILETPLLTNSFTAIKDTDAIPGRASVYSFLPEDGSDFYIATDIDGSDSVLWGVSTYGMPYLSLGIIPDEDGTLMFIKGTTETNIRLIREIR